MPPVQGTEPGTENILERHASDEEPFTALAFKVAADPICWNVDLFRVYSGYLAKGSYVFKYHYW